MNVRHSHLIINLQEIADNFKNSMSKLGFDSPNHAQFLYWLKTDGAKYLGRVSKEMFDKITIKFRNTSLQEFDSEQFEAFKKRVLNSDTSSVHNRVHRFYRQPTLVQPVPATVNSHKFTSKIKKAPQPHKVARPKLVTREQKMSVLTQQMSAVTLDGGSTDEINELIRGLRIRRI